MFCKLKRLWGLFDKGYGRYKFQIVVITAFGFLTGLMESLGITALIPLFSQLSGGEVGSNFIAEIMGKIVGWFDFGLGLKAILIFIAVAFALKALALVASRYFVSKIGADYERETRKLLLEKTLTSSWPFLLSQKIGYLETIVLRDVASSRSLFAALGASVIIVSNLLIYSVIAFLVSPDIATPSLLFGGFILLIFNPLFRMVRKFAGKAAQAHADVLRQVSEGVRGLKAIKANSAESKITEKADKIFDLLRHITIRQNLLKNVSSASIEPVSVIFISGIFAFAYITNTFELGAFAVTMYLIHRIFSNVKALQASFFSINSLVPHLQRVVNFERAVSQNKEVHRGTKDLVFEDRIEFRDVNFRYEGKKTRVLLDFNLNIEHGEMLGIIGESGAGKTTLVDLLLRLFEPENGKIYVDGLDVSEIDIGSWRKNIGYVSQDIFVMGDTIEKNIRFYDDSISDEDIVAATRKAHIYDFIQNLPKQFNAEVGERGALLSGGEKQRLVLARVLAHNPKILILDEATSALDNKSELMIQGAIEELKGTVTIFVIAHRLSTLLNCDRVIVLDEGKIKEQGSPKELLENKDSYFYKLYNIRDNAR